MSNYLTNLVRRGAGLAPPAPAAAIVPRQLPNWMSTGADELAEAPGFAAVEQAADVSVLGGTPRIPRELPSREAEVPSLRSSQSPATLDEGIATEPEIVPASLRTSARRPAALMPEEMSLHPDEPRSDPRLEQAAPRQADADKPAAAEAIIRTVPRQAEARVEPPGRSSQVFPSAPALPQQPKPDLPSVAPGASRTARTVRVETASAPAEKAPALLVPRLPQDDALAPIPDRDSAPALALPLERPPQIDQPVSAPERELQPTPARPIPLRPASPARLPEVHIEAAPEQRVTIRIGTIEIHTPAPRHPAADQVSPLAPPPPAPVGFDAYTQLRTYAPWNLQDRP